MWWKTSQRFYCKFLTEFSSEMVVKIRQHLLEFVVNCVIRKIFCTKSNDVVNDCLLNFNCVVSDAIYRKKLDSYISLNIRTIRYVV